MKTKTQENNYPLSTINSKLPKGWEIKKLGEVCELKSGTTIPSSLERVEGDVLYTKVADMNLPENLVEINTSSRFVNSTEIKKNQIIPEGAIIFPKRGGAIATNKKRKIIRPTIVDLNTMAIIPGKKINKDYFFHWFQLFDLNDISNGANIPQINNYSFDEVHIPYPVSLPEQQRIVSILDECFEVIERSRNAAIKNLKNAKELFESYLQGVFENGDWEIKSIEEVSDEIFAGGDAPKSNFSTAPNEKHKVPIYANAVKDRGLYGYTDSARVNKPCVTIAARGSGTGHTELRNEPFLPIVRLIVCIADTMQMTTEFLKYTIDSLVIQRSGSAIPQLTVPMIKGYKIPVPTIEEQEMIIKKTESLRAETQKLEAVYQKKINDLEELKKSILQKAFVGELKMSELGFEGLKDDRILKEKV